MAYKFEPYQQSEAVTNAGSALTQYQTQKPADYSSQYQTQLGNLQSQITNRQPFNYNVNGDALYQQYKDLYTTQGKQAMRDTMGQAANLTGGYGSSYGQAVGQQQYNAYLQQLNQIVPELQSAAYDRYNQQTQDLYNQYNMYYNQEAQDYSRYQDQMNAYNTELNRLQNVYDTERNYDYNKWQDQSQFDYTAWQANQAQAQAELEWYLQKGLTPPESVLEASGYDKQYVADYLAGMGSGGGWYDDGSYSGNGGNKINGLTAAEYEYLAGLEAVKKEYPNNPDAVARYTLICANNGTGTLERLQYLNENGSGLASSVSTKTAVTAEKTVGTKSSGTGTASTGKSAAVTNLTQGLLNSINSLKTKTK